MPDWGDNENFKRQMENLDFVRRTVVLTYLRALCTCALRYATSLIHVRPCVRTIVALAAITAGPLGVRERVDTVGKARLGACRAGEVRVDTRWVHAARAGTIPILI